MLNAWKRLGIQPIFLGNTHDTEKYGARLFGLADLVWAVSVTGLFGLGCSDREMFQSGYEILQKSYVHFLMQTYLNQRKVLFENTANMFQDPIVNQHERITIFVIISKQIKSLLTFSIIYKYFKLIITIQIKSQSWLFIRELV